ncbi:hypothetical protein ACMFMG_003303 [Clarireedia jacksonii]
MPPKKKKNSLRAASTPVGDDDPMIIDAPENVEPAKPIYDPLKDPWTDEQETSLFKGIVKWKPAGMHKHFRMIALSEHLRNHGYHPRYDPHTRIPGIWEKLRTCYNLDIIDERENTFEWDDDGDERFLEFKLPDEEYGETMFMRGKRSDDDVSESPSSPPRFSESGDSRDSAEAEPEPEIHGTKKRKRGDLSAKKDRASTVDTAETRTSPPAHSSPPPKSTRAGRSANRAAEKAKAESSSRQQSIATEEEPDDEEEDGEDGDEDQDQEDDDVDGTPTRTTRGDVKKAAKAKAMTRKSKRKR